MTKTENMKQGNVDKFAKLEQPKDHYDYDGLTGLWLWFPSWIHVTIALLMWPIFTVVLPTFPFKKMFIHYYFYNNALIFASALSGFCLFSALLSFIKAKYYVSEAALVNRPTLKKLLTKQSYNKNSAQKILLPRDIIAKNSKKLQAQHVADKTITQAQSKIDKTSSLIEKKPIQSSTKSATKKSTKSPVKAEQKNTPKKAVTKKQAKTESPKRSPSTAKVASKTTTKATKKSTPTSTSPKKKNKKEQLTLDL